MLLGLLDRRRLNAFVTARLGYVSPAYHAEVRDRLAEQNDRYEKALREILQTSDDGESMRIAADALGLSIDRTETPSGRPDGER